jgi:hypothetical protein
MYDNKNLIILKGSALSLDNASGDYYPIETKQKSAD